MVKTTMKKCAKCGSDKSYVFTVTLAYTPPTPHLSRCCECTQRQLDSSG
jgi:hypothetical protein